MPMPDSSKWKCGSERKLNRDNQRSQYHSAGYCPAFNTHQSDYAGVGAFISQGLEQIGCSNRDDVSGALKFLVIFVLCEFAAVVLAILGADTETFPMSLAAWRMVF